MTDKTPGTNRRDFLRTAGAAGLAAGVATFSANASENTSDAELLSANADGGDFAETDNAVASAADKRRNTAANIRIRLAKQNRNATSPKLQHPTNGDEARYADKRASFGKGLPHNADGTPDANAFATLVNAATNGEGRPELFDQIQLSDPASFPNGGRRLTNPQAGIAFEVEGADSHSLVIAPAPAFNSRAEVADIAENYWMALLRDVPFSQYSGNSIATAAAQDLTSFGADFIGAKNANGVVTPNLLFRGVTAGAKIGPFMSQFFYLPCAFGSNDIDQRTHTLLPQGRGGKDYLTTFASFLQVQRGANPLPASQIDPRSGAEIGTIDPTQRYMRVGRDIAQWVHNDVLFQAYFQAFLIISSLGTPPDAGNPYVGNRTQDGFATFGGPAIAAVLCEVATRALHAVWYQKWLVHRRLRPEAFGARLEFNRTNPGRFDVHPSANSSTFLPAILQFNERINGTGKGTYLLPIAFPEGSPTHPSYGAGHATVAGACTTILKAYFNEDTRISQLTQPVDASPDGLTLVPYTAADAGQLTVGGELEKMGYNVANGRNIAGMHWRTDSFASLALGEQVAIALLREQRATFNENFGGFTLTKFDGTKINV